MCGIYKITNTINNKVYIGQSSNIEARWKKHKSSNDDFTIHKAMRKYGLQNFTFSVIEECSKDLLDSREIYWINYYNSLEEGYNMIPGGSNGAGYAKGIPVEQYSLDGKYIITYNSAKQASEVTGIVHTDICKCCRGESNRAGLYQWTYKDSKKQIIPIDISDTKIQRRINQYSLKGELLQQYDNLAQASTITGINKSIICNVCKGKGHTAGGFRWSYEGEKLSEKKPHQNSGSRKQVCMYDTNNNLLKVFNSMSEASRETDIAVQHISRVCNGKGKTAGGFIWKFKGEMM